MKRNTWRTIAIVLAVLCAYQRYRACTRSTKHDVHAAEAHDADVDEGDASSPSSSSSSASGVAKPRVSPSLPETRKLFGMKLPGFVSRLLPQPGESLRDYRERVVPLAQLAIAPQRARVARVRDALPLDDHQRAELDGAVKEAASAIQDRVLNAVLSGELKPATFQPMTGVTMAREVLEIVEKGNARFTQTLSAEQRTQLAAKHFDFADYLLFATPWEDAIPRL